MSFRNQLSKNKSGVFYIFSGLFKTAVQTLSGFIILRWIEPNDLGYWQSFTVFAIYLNIFTLGVPTGLNRDLPFWLGRKEIHKVRRLVQAAGSYVSRISISIVVLTIVVSLLLYAFGIVDHIFSLMLFAAFSKIAISMQANLIGVTYRSNRSFKNLGKVQFVLAWIQLGLIPLVYFFEIWGYIAYQMLVVIAMYFGYLIKRPFNIKYKFHRRELIDLIKTGLPMFIWNFITTSSRTLPRLTLVVFGSPVLVGLFSPAESLSKAVQNLPNYINLFLFPKISFKFGQTNDRKLVIGKVFKAAAFLFITMAIISILLVLITPYLFEYIFPKYVESTLAVQLVICATPFYSVSQLIHNMINSFKDFKLFRYLVPVRLIVTIISITLFYLLFRELLVSVALSVILTEFLIMFSYIYVSSNAIK